MNKFEDNLKKIAKQNIDIPDDYENSVKDALEYISNIESVNSEKRSNKTKLPKNVFKSYLSKVAVVIIMFSIGLTAYATISGNLNLKGLGLNKLNNNYEENKVDVNKVIENDYLKLSINNIARDSAYIILEYKLELKEKGIQEIGEITYSEMLEYSIWLNSKITLNEERPSFGIDHLVKESDTEYSYYQIIYAMNDDNENIDLKIWYDSLINNTGGKEIPINEMFEISTKLENVEDNFERQEQKLSDGSTIILEKVMNTNFQTFVRIKRVIENVTLKEYDNNFNNSINFLITDNENNLIPYLTFDLERKYYSEAGERIDSNVKLHAKAERNNEKVRVEEDSVIIMDEIASNENIKIIPYRKRLNYDTKEEREMYNKATWYKLEEGTKIYSAKSDLGGILEINKIEIDDKNVTFYYNKNGIVENNATYILIRNNNGVMNYICATKQDIGNQGTIVFARDQIGTSGLIGWKNSPDEYYKMLEKLENLEFTLLFGHGAEYIGKPFETVIPDFSNQKLEIKNINQYKTKTVIINVEDERTKSGLGNNENLKYIIDYDKDNNILKCSGGDFNILNYVDGKNFKTIFPQDYKKVDELINKVEEHLKHEQMKYTIEYK